MCTMKYVIKLEIVQINAKLLILAEASQKQNKSIGRTEILIVNSRTKVFITS